MTKKTKEFWVLVGLTISIPIMIICALYVVSLYIPAKQINPIDKETVMNDTHTTFIVTNKYIYDNRVGIGINVYNYYLTNKSEFDMLEFKKQYTCNITTYGWLTNVTRSISDCKENKDFNYTKLFKLGE